MRFTVYKCDRCQAEYRLEGMGLYDRSWPLRLKVEIPLFTEGLAFTRSSELCWPCREHVVEAIKKALEKGS